MTRLLAANGGAVFAEFVIAFASFFVLFLSGVQVSIVATARLVAEHAAWQAARKAAVVIDDDPFFYASGRRKHLEGAGDAPQDEQAKHLLGLLFGPLGRLHTHLLARGSARLSAVRDAAYLPLGLVAPPPALVANLVPAALPSSPGETEPSLASDLGDAPILRVLMGFAVYGRAAGAIRFFDSAERDAAPKGAHDAAFGDTDTITVEVTYLVHCNVPLARTLACRPASQITGERGERSARRPRGAHARPGTMSPSTSERERPRLAPDARSLIHAEQPSLLSRLLAREDQYFALVRGRATVPNHGAAYAYHSELVRTPAGREAR